MIEKLLIYDALYSLYMGDELYSLPNTKGYFGFRLEHCREVYIIFEILLENKWIYLYHKNEHLLTYRITEDGLEVFKEGLIWYNNLKWYQKIFGRLGIL